MSNSIWYLKKSGQLAIVTTILLVIIGYIQSPAYGLILAALATFIYISIPNVIFILLICFINKDNKLFYTLPFMMIEVLLLSFLISMVDKIIAIIPEQYRYETTSSHKSLKPFFSHSIRDVYAYITLFFILILIRRIYMSKSKKIKESL